MKFSYTDERLTLECTPDEQVELREIYAANVATQDYYGFYNENEADFMERLICNSELDWTSAAQTGDLTDAPMLCVWGDENTPVAMRWGYPHYAVRSFLTDLMDTGKAVFLASW